MGTFLSSYLGGQILRPPFSEDDKDVMVLASKSLLFSSSSPKKGIRKARVYLRREEEKRGNNWSVMKEEMLFVYRVAINEEGVFLFVRLSRFSIEYRASFHLTEQKLMRENLTTNILQTCVICPLVLVLTLAFAVKKDNDRHLEITHSSE